MSRNVKIVLGVVVLVAVVSVGAFLYLTRDIAAPTQAVQDNVQELSTSDASTGQTVYRISQDNSTVSYTIDEVLNGSPNTVIGTTNQVAGDILVNTSNPAQSQIGDISINARTFATDDTRRNNAVARFILQSETDANQFITFKATSLTGLPASIKVGDTVTFKVTGNLTIAGVTKEVTFDATATLNAQNQLTGHAEMTTPYSAFNLSIPNVPFVASVDENVTLKLDFVANAVAS